MRKQKGFSLIELLIVVAIILIIAAIAIPSLLRSRIAANDSAAASTLRTINTSEITYLSAYPAVGYSQSLTSLGPNGVVCTAAGVVDQTHACLIDGTIGCAAANGPCAKSGFNYFMGGTAPGAGQPAANYIVSASPLSIGFSGDKNFCSEPDAVIRKTPDGTAPLALAAPGETFANCGNAANYVAIQ
jgi:prepilin-type N-terminal cleavage/methylation domain-containing protein